MKLFDFFRKDEPQKIPTPPEEELVAQKANMYIILEIFSAAYFERFKNLRIDPDTLTTDQSLFEVTKGDIITTSHMIIDMHEALNVKMDYLPGDEYTDFPTIGALIQYFLARFDYRINIENPHLLVD